MFYGLPIIGVIFNNLELLMILLILGFAIYGAIRGFFAQLVGTATTIIALVVATLISKGFMNLLCDYTGFDEFFSGRYEKWLLNNFDYFKGLSADEFSSAIDLMPFPKTVKNSIINLCASSGDGVSLAFVTAKVMAKYTVLAICFVFVFTGIKLLFLLLRKVGKELRKISLIRQVDNTLGAFLSIFRLYRILSFIFFVINITPLGLMDGVKNYIASSHIATFIYNINMFNWLVSLMQI